MWHQCAEYDIVRDDMSVKISCYNIGSCRSANDCQVSRRKRLIRDEDGSNRTVPKPYCCQGEKYFARE